MQTIAVVDYDPNWPAVFEDLRDGVWPTVKDFANAVEHVGSTSVPGLAAKPIIDMTIVVASNEEVPRAVNRLATIGYKHLGDLGIQDREAFQVPKDLPIHHLYVCPEGSLGLINHITLRDYLRTHPKAARQYGELKKQLAARFPNDINSYVAGKTNFILSILHRCGLSHDQLESIKAVNRA